MYMHTLVKDGDNFTLTQSVLRTTNSLEICVHKYPWTSTNMHLTVS